MGKDAAAPKQHPNTQILARLTHLYRVSTALVTPDPAASQETNAAASKLSNFYINHLRSAAKKNVLRLHSEVKRTICKRCEALLIPGVSCTERIENQSKGGKKRWADVLVIECTRCGTAKRFPVGMDEFKSTKGQPKYRVAKKGAQSEMLPGGESLPGNKGRKGNPPDKNAGKKGGKKQQQRQKQQQQDSRVFRLPATLKVKGVVNKGTTTAEEAPKQASTLGVEVKLPATGDVEMKDISAIKTGTNG